MAQQSWREMVMESLDIEAFDFLTETELASASYHGDTMRLVLLVNPLNPRPSFKVEVGGYGVHHCYKLSEAVEFYNNALIASPPVRSALAL